MTTTQTPQTTSAQTPPSALTQLLTSRVAAVVRIAFGFTFLWAFLDKAFALGFSTGRDDAGVVDRFGDAAWINGGSPTNGFLAFGADGPFKGIYNNIAGAAWADVLFMLGLLGIGLALMLGVGVRVAAGAGIVLYLLMWTVALPPQTNPIIDDHILGALTLALLALLDAGHTWGLGARWSRSDLVARFPAIR